MYHWFNKHLDLGRRPVVEEDFKPLTIAEMTVWDAATSEAAGRGEDYERSLLKNDDGRSDRQLAALPPTQCRRRWPSFARWWAARGRRDRRPRTAGRCRHRSTKCSAEKERGDLYGVHRAIAQQAGGEEIAGRLVASQSVEGRS